MSKPVMFYVQHLMGIGHVMRMAAIVREISRRNIPVTLVSGGEPVALLELEKADFVQLPVAKVQNKAFNPLYDENGQPVDDDWRQHRKRRLLEVFSDINPGVLVVELFPFGRRQFRFELMPLLQVAKTMRPRPHIISSLRDILVAKKRYDRNLEMVEVAETYFDTILVHGDPEFVPLSTTFPLAERLKDKLRYTGYVVSEANARQIITTEGSGEVIVSVGSGNVGEALLNTVIKTRPLCSLKNTKWRLLPGHGMSETYFQKLTANAGEGFIVERARPDFTTLLANCKISISQGGYNTVMDILGAKAKSVIVPYADGKESEQALRARLLQERGLLHVLDEKELTPQNLAKTIDTAMNTPIPENALVINTKGSKISADIISSLAKFS